MKILILSHLPISNLTSMGKTLKSLFCVFSKSELCQLYIYPSVPNIDLCNSYYRITDKEVLRSYFTNRFSNGYVEADLLSDKWIENDITQRIYRNPYNKTNVIKLLRDLMWYFSGWFNCHLKKWLISEKPDCIFVALGDSCFLYNMAIQISHYLNIPVIPYICDDYYFAEYKGMLNRLHHSFLKIYTHKLFEHSNLFVGICDSIVKKYSKYFTPKGITIMTASSYTKRGKVEDKKDIINLGYFGNIILGRYKILYEIGKALDEINEYYKTNYTLNIYTQEKESIYVELFKNIKSVIFRGFVAGVDYEIAYNGSDILLHVESFDEVDKRMTMHSVSTKIPDILASGKYFIAIGPEEIASMRHLIENKCAASITDSKHIKEFMYQFLSNIKILYDYACNGLIVAEKYHGKLTQSYKLRNALLDLISN